MKKIVLLLSLSFLCACENGPVGSAKNPLKVMFTPYVEGQTVAENTQGLSQFLEKSLSEKWLHQPSGFHVKIVIPTSYIAIIEGFGTKRVDVAGMTTFPYVLARDVKKYPVEAFLTMERGVDGKMYKGAIITRSDSPIKSVEDLKGKKFAYSDPASTSGYILPSKFFKDKHIELKDTVFAGRHDAVVMMVQQKQVDAGAIFYMSPEIRDENGTKKKYLRDARQMVITQIPDVEQKIKIIAYTPMVPNEPIVIRTNLFADPAEQARFKAAFSESFIEFCTRPEGKDLMQKLLRADKIVPTRDADYDILRTMLTDLNLDPAQLVKKK